MTVPASSPSLPENSPVPSPVTRLLDSEQRDRARDRGRFNQYGMRDDARAHSAEVDRANPGNGDHARRFGAGGDPSTYTNRPGSEAEQQVPQRDTSSDAPAHKPGP